NLLKERGYKYQLTAFFLLCSLMLFSQTSEVKGLVLDDAGIPLPGASVLIKGTTKGTVTDFNGNFTISVTDPSNTTLVISFISYQVKEIPVNNQSFIEVNLAADVAALDEVVVIGYGNQKRTTLTGCI